MLYEVITPADEEGTEGVDHDRELVRALRPDRLRAYARAAQQHGAHPDQAAIPHLDAVQHGAVAHGDLRPDHVGDARVGVDQGQVLDMSYNFV